jgi:Rhs element Vgr protein
MVMTANDADSLVNIALFSEGVDVTPEFEVMSIHIQRSMNMVPSARIEMRDGNVAERKFTASDAAAFRPGARIRIDIGHGKQLSKCFEGLVVKHGIRAGGDNRSRLIIECRDRAAAMCMGRRNANYADRKDSEIIETLISSHGLTARVAATTLTHKMLVQHYSTDWDFMLSRAEASGALVVVHDGNVQVAPPQLSAQPVLKLTYGEDLIEFEAEMDARSQLTKAQAVCWDPKTQALLEGNPAVPQPLNPQGDLDSKVLARILKLDVYRLQTGAAATKESLTQWASSQQLKAGLARIRGYMKLQGSAAVLPGALIDVAGVGAHFTGKVLISRVEHHVEEGSWITTAHFGLQPNWFTERADVLAPAAGGLLPAARGLTIGVVLKLEGDPDGQHRVQVSVPVLQAQSAGIWARLATLQASAGFGTYFVPEIGDEVVLGYFNEDPSCPVILGGLHSSKRTTPHAHAATNDIKAIVTRCKSTLEFNEADKAITLTTPGNNRVVLNDSAKSIVIHDQNDNKITLDRAGIKLESPKDITITGQGKFTVDAVGPISLNSKADVKAMGLNVSCEAQVAFTGKGSASAEVSAAGQTVLKGALVMIN